MSDRSGCWFCGRPAPAAHAFRVGLHRDVETTPIAGGLAGFRDEWATVEVAVPRCGRCRAGHHVEVLLFVVGLPLVVWDGALLADLALGNHHAPPATLGSAALMVALAVPFGGWLALRHGWAGLARWLPRNRRHARRHPAVRERLEDGWKYGRAPLAHWDRRI